MLGKPKYKHGDIVMFNWNGEEKIGHIYIVDSYGTFEQNEEPSYDVMVEKEECLYKHCRESSLFLIKRI